MKKSIPAGSPDEYVAGLTEWRYKLVASLRKAVREAGEFDEQIKWGHLVYFSNGPALLIRAEEERVLFGFWRGKRLRELDERLKPGGKYEMATMTLVEGDKISAAQTKKLAAAAIELNRAWGDPTAAAPKSRKKTPREHVQYHRDGSIWAKGQMLADVACGYWEWFRKDGTRLRSGHFADGEQVGAWTTYDKNGEVYKVTQMKPKVVKSKRAMPKK